MRHIKRKINLSDYKSFMNSQVMAFKNNTLTDMTQTKYQILFNQKSNYGMLPATCCVEINGVKYGDTEKEKEQNHPHWPWHTLHKLYKFYTTITKDMALENENGVYDEYITYFKIDERTWRENYDKIKTDIINYVEKGKTQGDYLNFSVKDELTLYKGCGDPNYHTCFDIPIYLNEQIDNLGSMNEIPNEWVKQTLYKDGEVVKYDGKDWRLKNGSILGKKITENGEEVWEQIVEGDEVFWKKITENGEEVTEEIVKTDKNFSKDFIEISADGYTWNNTYLESVFGNLTYDENEGTYVEKKSNLPWERNIEYERGKRDLIVKKSDGTSESFVLVGNTAFEKVDNSFYHNDFASFLGSALKDNHIISSSTKDFLYAYKNFQFIPSPNLKKMADVYSFQGLDSNKGEIGFFVDNNEIYIVKEYDIITDISVDLNPCFSGLTSVDISNSNYYLVEFEYPHIQKNPYINLNSKKLYGHREGENYIFEADAKTYISRKVVGIFFNGRLIEPSVIDNVYEIIIENYKKFKVLDKSYYWTYVDEELYIYSTKKETEKKLGKYILKASPLNETDTEIEYFYDWEPLSDLDNMLGSLANSLDITENTQKLWYVNETEVDDVKSYDLYILKPYQKYDLKHISGTTSSHLSLFRNCDCTYDELGVPIYGQVILKGLDKETRARYKGILRPLPNDSLSLLYIPKTVSYVEEVEKGVFFGNLLDTIEFYIEHSDGRKEAIPENIDLNLSSGAYLKELYNEYTIFYDGSTNKYKCCKKTNVPKEIDEETLLDFEKALGFCGATLKVKFTYYLGAYLKKTDEERYQTLSDDEIIDSEKVTFRLDDERFQGVKYIDEYTIVRHTTVYNRSISNQYLVYYYEMIGEPLENVGDFSNNDVKATFKMEIPIQSMDEKTFKVDTINQRKDLEEYNGFTSLPLYRNDYNIGTAYQEKVLGDIYIDRGISFAFEKHLKLQEISSLNDLENYSNGGFFTITSDK